MYLKYFPILITRLNCEIIAITILIMHGEIEQLVLLNDSVVGKMHAIC